jgi:hypothetical protein
MIYVQQITRINIKRMIIFVLKDYELMNAISEHLQTLLITLKR